MGQIFGSIIGGWLWVWLFGGWITNKFWPELEPDPKAFRGALVGSGVVLLAAISKGNLLLGVFGFLGVIVGWWWLRRENRKYWLDFSDSDTFS